MGIITKKSFSPCASTYPALYSTVVRVQSFHFFFCVAKMMLRRATTTTTSSSSRRHSNGCLTALAILLIGGILASLGVVDTFTPSSRIGFVPASHVVFPGNHPSCWTQQQQRLSQSCMLAAWRGNTNRDNADNNGDMAETAPALPSPPPPDILVAETSLGLQRISWFSWWCQMILTVTSSVILIFAKNVVSSVRDAQVNFVLAGSGIVMSFLSIFWTWGGGARLSRRLTRRPTSRIQNANMLRKAINVGTSLNLIGMFLTLLGAEQTVGVLAIKTLTAKPWNSPTGLPMLMDGLQPLDILVVQANTNSLFSHFVSLVCLLFLNRYVDKLDPPSQEENSNDEKKEIRPRKRK